LNISIFSSIILTIGFSILFYSNDGIHAQSADIVFVTTNASTQSFGEHNFTVIFNNLPQNEMCKSKDCLLEIIKFHDSGHPAGGVSLPTPEIQSMYSGVDVRIHDLVYQNMSDLEREYQERWTIWANCDIEEIKDTIFVCGKNTFDTITLSNDFRGIEMSFPLITGTYDPGSNVMKFTSNFK
jgi:hypothetical protein